MIMPFSLLSFGGLHSDYSKKLSLGLDYSYETKGNNSAISLRATARNYISAFPEI